MPTMKQLEEEIEKIKARNKRVEADKAWETSNARKALLMVYTYLAVALYLLAVHIPNALLTAIVPTIGFMLSTLTLPFFKDIWLRRKALLSRKWSSAHV